LPGWVLCAAFMLAHPVAAVGPVPYGEDFVRLGERWPDGGPVLQWRDSSSGPARGVADYRRQLLEMEQAAGPYADALAEPLASLGRYHRQLGEYEQAQQLYLRALHVVRINDGLYSERQIPILKELLDSYRAAGDLEALDARYDYFFRLYGSGQPPYTDLRLRAAVEYLRWQREAVRIGVEKEQSRRLLALYDLNKQLLDGVAADESASFALYRELVLSQLRNLYLVSDRIAPEVQTIGVHSNTPLFGADWSSEDFGKKQLEGISRSAVTRGRALLEELIARTPPRQPDELAGVYLELADWNQWNGHEGAARQGYEQVVELLQQANRQDLLQQWLARAVELPDNGAFWQPRQELSQRRHVVQARYDVSARGRAKNVEVTAADPEDERLASTLRRGLGKTRFRPRFINGQAQADEQLVRDYELLK
jgi:hypothetical protein